MIHFRGRQEAEEARHKQSSKNRCWLELDLQQACRHLAILEDRFSLPHKRNVCVKGMALWVKGLVPKPDDELCT